MKGDNKRSPDCHQLTSQALWCCAPMNPASNFRAIVSIRGCWDVLCRHKDKAGRNAMMLR